MILRILNIQLSHLRLLARRLLEIDAAQSQTSETYQGKHRLWTTNQITN